MLKHLFFYSFFSFMFSYNKLCFSKSNNNFLSEKIFKMFEHNLRCREVYFWYMIKMICHNKKFFLIAHFGGYGFREPLEQQYVKSLFTMQCWEGPGIAHCVLRKFQHTDITWVTETMIPWTYCWQKSFNIQQYRLQKVLD